MVDKAQVTWSRSDRGLSCRVRPTWVGVRPYAATDGTTVRVLRRPRQVNAPGHLETLKRLTVTRQHPRRGNQRVFLSAAAAPGTPAPWDPGVELRPHKEYFEGSVGDAVTIVDVPGLGRVPEVETTIVGADLIGDVRAGALEVSYGYVSFFVDAADVPEDPAEGAPDDWAVVGVGLCHNPVTGEIEEFDVEGIVDPADPRVPADLRDYLGGNHVAAGLGGLLGPGGRGGREVRLLPLVGDDASPACRVLAARGDDGSIAVVLASPTDEGPCAVLLGGARGSAAYDSMAAMRSVHAGGPLAGTLTPMTLAYAGADNQPGDSPANEPATPEENATMADTVTPVPGQGGAPGGDPAAMLQQKLTALEEQAKKQAEQIAALTAQLAEMATKLAAANADKAQAQATADSLREQLVPHEARALAERKKAAAVALGATGELADKIGKAGADELDGLVVRAYYDGRPELRSAIDDLDAKLADKAYVRARADVLIEQGPRRQAAAASDSFRESFRVVDGGRDGEQPRPKTMQERIDAENASKMGGES